ncbi:MAG TPA: hypothetical protein VFP23_03910 [Solirubrobacterales bacterium]|nr:hypothetical protein [Solirubrobacterales bacterium]
MRPLTRIGLLSVGVLIAAFESGWFSHGLGWVSAIAAFLFILPAIFGGRVQG